MAIEFLEGLRAEEARLTRSLQESSIFRQLEAVKDSIAKLERVYLNGESAAPGEFILGSATVSETRMLGSSESLPPKEVRQRANSLTSRVATVAERLFRETNKRHQSGVVIDLLVREAVISGRTKSSQSAVASILSHHRLFDNKHDSHGLGYGLREWSQIPTQTPEPITQVKMVRPTLGPSPSQGRPSLNREGEG